MLIDSPRITPADRAVWARHEFYDRIAARDPRWPVREERARRVIADFLARGPAFVGVSWGKDSVVVAHLAIQVDPGIPLRRMVRDRPVPGRPENPDCDRVEEAFLDRFPHVDYEVYPVRADVLDRLAVMDRELGGRHISGVRAEESTERRISAAVHGDATARACRPILRWSTADVFAYLYRHELPVHPAYAMTGGGAWSRERIRVHELGGDHGRGAGRWEWERLYYGDVLDASLRS